jgi:hypothetical protein
MKMVDVRTFEAGNYKFVNGAFMYSAGIAALPGFRIERVRFSQLLPVEEGFRRAAEIMHAAGRPKTAFAACELRSPEPFTETGFVEFNKVYVQTLKAWDIIEAQGTNPVARSNVCPEIAPPGEPSFYAFSYTVQDEHAKPSFVIAGSGEAEEGAGSYSERTVARGDTSPSGMRQKARHVLGEMERRMGALGFSWKETTAAQAYTVYDIHPFLGEELARRGAIPAGLTWQFCRPPVVGLDYEMDCRGVHIERVV